MENGENITPSRPHEVRIREARADDVQDIVRIYIKSWNVGFAGLMPAREITADVLTQWTPIWRGIFRIAGGSLKRITV